MTDGLIGEIVTCCDRDEWRLRYLVYNESNIIVRFRALFKFHMISLLQTLIDQAISSPRMEK